MYQSSKGIAYWLSLLDWDLFATLTFRNPLPPEGAGWALAWRHLHRVSDFLGTPYSSLLIALRSERGEIGDRFHFHYLLGRTRSSNLHSDAHRVGYDWHKATGGHPVIRVYDPRLANEDYIEKGLGGANLYELGKYNKADRLELSRSVLKAVKFLRCSKSDFSVARQCEKTGGSRSPSLASPVGVALNIPPALPKASSEACTGSTSGFVRCHDGIWRRAA